MACSCPEDAALTTLTPTTCAVEIGQIQRAFFARKGNVIFDTATAGAANVPATIANDLVTVIAGWNILKVAADSTKVVFAPLFGGDIAINPSESITQGGNDNSTRNGETYYVSTPASTFTGRFDQLSAAQTKDLKALKCEDLEVYFVNEEGDIIGEASVTGQFKGFDCTNVVLGSRSVQGIATRDSNILTFQLDADWDTYFQKQTPTDFKALTGI